MTRVLVRASVALAAFSAVAPTVAPVASAAPTPSIITSVRIGHHATFDRLVFTFRGPVPTHDVRYVSAVYADASGRTVALLGAAKLRVVLHPTSTTTRAPQGTWTPRYPEIRQVKGAGDFEGVTSYGVGLTKREPLHVFTLRSPNRLVVDVQLPH